MVQPQPLFYIEGNYVKEEGPLVNQDYCEVTVLFISLLYVSLTYI